MVEDVGSSFDLINEWNDLAWLYVGVVFYDFLCINDFSRELLLLELGEFYIYIWGKNSVYMVGILL